MNIKELADGMNIQILGTDTHIATLTAAYLPHSYIISLWMCEDLKQRSESLTQPENNKEWKVKSHCWVITFLGQVATDSYFR